MRNARPLFRAGLILAGLILAGLAGYFAHPRNGAASCGETWAQRINRHRGTVVSLDAFTETKTGQSGLLVTVQLDDGDVVLAPQVADARLAVGQRVKLSGYAYSDSPARAVPIVE